MNFKKTAGSLSGLFYPFFSFFVLFLFLGLAFQAPEKIYCQNKGLKYLKNYSRKEYGEQPQNWSILQDKRGLIYVGNNGCILEFDGISWRPIFLKDYRPVRSLAIDDAGTIYIGGINEIGFLAPGPNGSLQYRSLVEHLDKDIRNFSRVKRTHATKEGIYFKAAKFLFRWGSEGFKVWKSSSEFDLSFYCRGRLFVREKNIGLMQMVKDSLVPVPGGKIFAGVEIFMIAPFTDQRILIATLAKGFYLYDGNEVTPFPTEVDDYLRENRLYHGIRLFSGEYALATSLGGLIIIDARGKLKQIFDKTFGLQDNNVRYVFEDIQGNLWLGLNYGISKIEYNSPFSLYDERVDVPTNILSVTRYKQALYVGSTSGLCVLAAPFKKFRQVPGISSNCWSLISIGDSLLAATSTGVMLIEKGEARKVIKDSSYALHQSKKDKNRIWVGTKQVLVSLYRTKGRWTEEFRYRTEAAQIRTIVEDIKGKVWLGAGFAGVLKLDFSLDMNQPVVSRYDKSHGLPDGVIRVFRAAGHVMFATEKGIYCFDEANQQFIPDTTLGSEFTNVDRVVFRIAEDQNKNIWFHSKSRNFQAVPRKERTYTINKTPFLRLPRVQVNTIYPDGDSVWFGTNDNLLRFDTSFKKNYQQDFRSLIRRVVVNGKEILYDGKRTRSVPYSLFAVLPFKKRNLLFEFAAAFFEDESSTRYRCFLVGYEKNWSEWGAKTRANYTNLDAGTYKFHVEAKNVYGCLSSEAVFKFRILPPWYRTWWAFAVYIIIFLLLMYAIVKWRSGKLQKEKQKLEQIVKERTGEINYKNQQLESQTTRLKEQSEKLQEMAKVKARFFANISHEFRTPLTLITGPLEKMLAKAGDKEQEKELGMMVRNSQRLLSLINQLLDLSKLDSGKMRLKISRQSIIPFLKGILASFESLAKHNRINLDFYTKDENITFYFDPGKLEDVICNLLSNALKFTPAGGKVSVSVKKGTSGKGRFSAGFIEISVKDTGIGIPEKKLAHIFDRFFQAEGSVSDARKQAYKGTGIGLALAKELVTLHGGRIDVHSSEGKGTEFVLRFPVGKGHLKQHEIIPLSEAPSHFKKAGEIAAIYAKGEGESKGMGEDEPERELDRVESSGETGAPVKDIILIVEDNADVRAYIRDPLKSDYIVVEARDGREGITKAVEIIPDLIVSDIMMPEVDGYELCRVLKKEVRTSHVPIILLTAKASEDSIVQGLETGADDYITKPFNTRILCTRIKNLIELRRQLQEKIQRKMLLQPDEISVSSIDQKFIEELQEMIEKNLSDPEFNVEGLSKKLYMSRSNLYRKIVALTGETPAQFLRSYRLKRGAQLLKANFGNVSQVALEVGFSNMAYFAGCFKEKFHQSPSAYQAAES